MSGTWQLELSGNLSGKPVNNVFHYFSDVAGSNALTLCDNFDAQILPAILDITSTELTYTDVKVNGIIGTPDIASKAITASGTRTGQFMPTFVAWSFRLNRTNNLFRNGYKRFAGVTEEDVEDGVPVAGILLNIQAVELVLASQIVVDSDVYDPVIVQKVADGVALDPWIVWPFETASFIKVSSQTSRKK